ncbi:hypothetical protein [Streptomyces sp. WM6378]|uniref:hypothetical protein n=1 Tax=Streptomyces sp. WM6378 TaxID=1415557 RepID=UPI0006C00004|nr:hypothetical protein [Streptomyces sp. WM6378]KOU50135.1 hypothetical protein ADK54_09810 [Streptomyces sp. WM6378]
MNVLTDIAAICHPMPAPGDVPDDVFNDVCHAVQTEREAMIHNLEAAALADWEEHEPLLSAIGMAHYRKSQAEDEIRRLIAYGREFARPRPYKLADLAAASGMSISGIRTAYGHGEVAAVEQALGRTTREDWRATPPDDPADGQSTS